MSNTNNTTTNYKLRKTDTDKLANNGICSEEVKALEASICEKREHIASINKAMDTFSNYSANSQVNFKAFINNLPAEIRNEIDVDVILNNIVGAKELLNA